MVAVSSFFWLPSHAGGLFFQEKHPCQAFGFISQSLPPTGGKNYSCVKLLTSWGQPWPVQLGDELLHAGCGQESSKKTPDVGIPSFFH